MRVPLVTSVGPQNLAEMRQLDEPFEAVAGFHRRAEAPLSPNGDECPVQESMGGDGAYWAWVSRNCRENFLQIEVN